jgi:GT2 family glycosyltransferase
VKVSAIIPTYNRSAILRRTLKSVFELDPLPHELLIVDQSDVPDPELGAVLRNAPRFLKVRYILQRPPNAQAARNRAAVESTGDILLFLDDDILVEEDLVSAHLRNYLDPDIGAVGGYFLEPGETPTADLPPVYFRKHTGWIYLPHGYTKRFESGLLPSCNGSIRRDVLIRAGGFDENYIRTLLDDTDLSCRLRRQGVRIIHDPDARGFHLKEPTGGKRSGGMNRYVIADSAAWQIWFYFFGTNFGFRAWREILIRFRRCVLRKVNLLRPWYLITAFGCFLMGAYRAFAAVRGGRRLPLTFGASRVLSAKSAGGR